MPKSNDHIIKPFTLTPHEKSLPLGLTSIAHSTFHTRITTIPADSKLTSLLSLETLKKKTSYDSSSQFNQGVVSPKKAASQTKGGEKRKRRVSQSNSSTDLALLEQGSDSFQKKRVRGSGVGAGSGGRKSDSAADKSGSSASNGSDGRSISLSVLQPKLEAVFKVFWELELDPPSLATPFFGLITRNNWYYFLRQYTIETHTFYLNATSVTDEIFYLFIAMFLDFLGSLTRFWSHVRWRIFR